MNLWILPQKAEINGKTYPINADYRDVLDVISYLTDPNQEEGTALYIALALFYEGFEDMPEDDYREAAEWMFHFISGSNEEQRGQTRPKTIDWEQDQAMIIADVNKVAGREVRALPFCHWWTFLAWFNGIGEGQLLTVVSIREKLRKHKKLTDWERDFYRENRSKIDFQRKYSQADDELLKDWMGK